MRDFEDYCWRDVVSNEDLYIYSAYVRERSVGPRPALVVVHPGAAPSGAAWQDHAARLLSEARARGIPVVHSIPPGTTPTLMPGEAEPLVMRPCDSAFFSSDLERALHRLSAGSLLLCGGPSSAALRASAVEGKSFGYKVVIAEETVGDVSQFLHKVALFDIAHKYADVMSIDELLAQL
jgi:nicotinamidase-related amidase